LHDLFIYLFTTTFLKSGGAKNHTKQSVIFTTWIIKVVSVLCHPVRYLMV